MKRLPVFFAVMLVVIAFAAAAWAGESWVFTDQQEKKIKDTIKVTGQDRQIEVSFSENYWNGSLVDCTTSRREEAVQIFIYVSGGVDIIAIGSDEKKTREFAEKIKDRVEAIFNHPASEELGRDFLK